MEGGPLSDAELEEVRDLHALFSELELHIIELCYRKHGRDRKETQEALVELLKSPRALDELMAQSTGQQVDASTGPAPASDGLGAAAALPQALLLLDNEHEVTLG